MQAGSSRDRSRDHFLSRYADAMQSSREVFWSLVLRVRRILWSPYSNFTGYGVKFGAGPESRPADPADLSLLCIGPGLAILSLTRRMNNFGLGLSNREARTTDLFENKGCEGDSGDLMSMLINS